MYNYMTGHVRGKSNYIADVLSRRLVWMNLESTTCPQEGLDLDQKEDYTMRNLKKKYK